MNQNNAAQPVLTDDEILQVFADIVGNQEDDARFIDVDRDQAIRIARALLSKLRAPVAGEAGDTLKQVYDAFGIGVLARTPSTLMACLGNVIRRAHCLSQVEQVLSVPTPPEPEDDGIWGEESLLRWGADEKGYAEHFRAALAEWSRRTALASAPVSDEPCKRCGGPGWYTNHTTGYPESFPCIACNPQGVSVERLAKDPFLAAQLWRKPAEADGSLLERILEHVGEYGESMASSTLLSVRTIARRNVETRIAAELASAPVAGEAQEDLAPPKCPITGRPFFMALEHPELGMVPTYGGPYDSYTIPHLGGKPDQPWHERELRVYRYDHDRGGWLTDEVEVIPLRIVHEDVLHELEDAAPQASEAVPTEPMRVFSAGMWTYDGTGQAFSHTELDEAAFVTYRAALSAQPGAQKEQSDA